MRVWTSAWIEPGRLVCAASPASRSSCSRNSGLPSARSTQLATSAARHGRGERGQALRIVARQRAEVDAERAARRAATCARRPRSDRRRSASSSPAGAAASRRARRARRGARASRRRPSGCPRRRGAAAAPRAAAATRSQRRASEPCSRAVGAHRRGERAQLGRRRDVEQVVQEEALFGGDRPGLASPARSPSRRAASSAVPATPSRLRARLRTASRPVSAPKSSTGAAWQEKPRSRADRDELGDQARLADAGVAAHDDDAAALALGAGLGDGAEVAQLLVAPDQRRRAAAGASRSPRMRYGDERLVLALERSVGTAASASKTSETWLPGRRADDDLARRGERCAGGRRC